MTKNTLKKMIIAITPWMEQDEKIYKMYRKAHMWIQRNNKYLAYYYTNKIYKRYGCIISPKAKIGKNLKLPHPIGVVIGEGVEIGDNVTIYQNTTIGRKYKNIEKYPKICNNVTIYCNTSVIGDITIENDVIIGCNSVVLKTVNKNSVCAGVIK